MRLKEAALREATEKRGAECRNRGSLVSSYDTCEKEGVGMYWLARE